MAWRHLVMHRIGVLVVLLLLSLAGSLALPADETVTAGSDSRADRRGLPADEQPWWPSRYGPDDQRGTLNEITPAVVRAAVALVKSGTVVDLGRVLDEDTPKFPGRYWHQTVELSPHVTNLRRPDAVGKGWGKKPDQLDYRASGRDFSSRYAIGFHWPYPNWRPLL